MHNVPFVVTSKFGITDHARARRKNVSETTPGYVFYLFDPVQIPFGRAAEQLVHLLYFWANLRNIFPFWYGSGSREWFFNVNPVVCGVVWYLGQKFGWTFELRGHELPVWYLFILSPLIWLDGLLWFFLFQGLTVALIIALAVALYFVLSIS